MKDAFIVDAIRTPIGNFGATLSPVRTDDLATIPIKELMARNASLDPNAIEDLILAAQIKLEKTTEMLLEWRCY